MKRETARELGTTERTIKVHRWNVMEKAGIPSVAELVLIVERLDSRDQAVTAGFSKPP
jgi:FixJ family two-component response regulator